MKFSKEEYYITRTYTHYLSRRHVIGRWKMIREFFRFLSNKKYLVVEIGKINNYELKQNQLFYYNPNDNEWHLEENRIKSS